MKKNNIILLLGAAGFYTAIFAGPLLAHAATIIDTTSFVTTSTQELIISGSPYFASYDLGQVAAGAASGTTLYLRFYTGSGNWDGSSVAFNIDFYSTNSYSSSLNISGNFYPTSTNALQQTSYTLSSALPYDAYARATVALQYTSRSGSVLGSNGAPWLCISTLPSFSDCSLPNGWSPLAVNILSPSNGTTTPNFSYWVVGSASSSINSFTAPGDILSVIYWQGTSTVPINEFVDNETMLGNGNDFSRNEIIYGSSTIFSQNYFRLIPKRAIADFGAYGPTSTWQVEIGYGNAIGSAFSVVSTSTFYFDASAPVPTICGSPGCIARLGYHTTFTPATSTACGISATGTGMGTEIQYAGCQLFNILFVPSNDSKGQVVSGFSDIGGDFPFSAVNDTIGQFITAAINQQTSTNNPGISLPIFTASAQLLTSSTLSDFVGQSNKSLIFQTEDAAAWVGVAWTIIKVIF